ncbi:MarR family transcriptional regulator [Nocardia sp. NPDC101769]|uniref:helix-turn-helix domain-containing protein n=1 Tax=Nocardia sp. NPDC101769 TaxID=3364333 RepID=UPI0037FEF2C6
MKIGESALPPTGFQQMPASMRSVMIDIFENPDTAIREIVGRTGFLQSHVSASVAKLREAGVVDVMADPSDRRRTLVRRTERITGIAEAVRSNAPIDEAIADTIHSDDPNRIKAVTDALDTLAFLLKQTPLDAK